MTENTTMLEISEYRLRFTRALTPVDATLLRGHIGDLHRDNVLLHHHQEDGSLRYDYPLVQFKVLDHEATLIGIGEGADVVERLMLQLDEVRLRQDTVPVLDAGLTRRREALGEAERPLRYRFLSPWLGLNQENHLCYARLRSWAERQALLARILVGNSLALAKAFGHRVTARLEADVSGLRETTCRLKGVPMVAFWGTFAVNFRIPARLGIGKSVSRGFGTVEPTD